MTDDELLQRARSAVPEALRTRGEIVRRLDGGAPLMGAVDTAEKALLNDLEKLLEMSLPKDTDIEADSVDVAFHHESDIGQRTVVVQIRDGSVKRVIGQA